jgi:hypothetical protein
MKFTTKPITPTNLCTWYRDFHCHCLACGIVTIPYELFTNDGHVVDPLVLTMDPIFLLFL